MDTAQLNGVHEIVRGLCPEEHYSILLSQEGDNTTLLNIRCSQRHKLWIKIFNEGTYTEVKSEYSIVKMMTNKLTCIPAPLDFGNVLYDGSMKHYIIYEDVATETVGLESEITLEMIKKLFSNLGALHKLMRDLNFSELRSPQLTKSIQPTKQHISIGTDQLLSELVQLKNRIISKNPQIIHGDIYRNNVIFSQKEAHVIDFSDMRIGAVEEDVAGALIIAMESGIKSNMEELLRTYELSSNNCLDKFALYSLMLYNIMVYGKIEKKHMFDKVMELRYRYEAR
jgi:hypothetical protein